MDYLSVAVQGYFLGKLKLAEIQLVASYEQVSPGTIVHKVRMQERRTVLFNLAVGLIALIY